MSIGLLLGIVSIIFLSFFNEQQQLEIWVILLVAIDSVYIGFGINDGRKVEMLTEVTFEILFIVVAFLGLWVSVWISRWLLLTWHLGFSAQAYDD